MIKGLAPCPWCKLADGLQPLDLIDEPVHKDDSQTTVIYCRYCGSQGPHSVDQEDATNSWNRYAV